MQPAAHLQAAIELLDQVHHSNETGGLPIDVLIKAYFKTRRYAGSGDRRKVRDVLFDMLRHWGIGRWWAAAAGLPAEARSWAIGILSQRGDGLAGFGAGPFAPPALSNREAEALARMRGAAATEWATANMPEALFEVMQQRYAYAVPSMVNALAKRAPVTLRVNLAKTTFTRALAALRASDIDAQPGVFSATAIHIPIGTDVSAHPLYLDGHIEVQDEASQLCAALVAPPPGGTVIDLCAGAGGKALAIAALNPKAKIIACDTSKARLDALTERAARAGARSISTVLLPPDFPQQPCPELAAFAHTAHQVLIDAPCSSSGTWRRRPEVRWRYDSAAIARFSGQQRRLCAAGASLLRRGGRLCFATCSLLPQEGEAVFNALQDGQISLEVLDYRTQIPPKAVKKMPETLSNIKECLLVSPHIHGCDGFFAAALKRV
ncbi:MAG: RsmB/NOP family class I SAM-dependent RNA methyltransferase [Pseudomonadota bacterium]